MQKFSLTLFSYSRKAYEYLRETMENCLPHPSTIIRWLRKIDGSPGLCDQSFKQLKGIVEEKKMLGQQVEHRLSSQAIDYHDRRTIFNPPPPVSLAPDYHSYFIHFRHIHNISILAQMKQANMICTCLVIQVFCSFILDEMNIKKNVYFNGEVKAMLPSCSKIDYQSLYLRCVQFIEIIITCIFPYNSHFIIQIKIFIILFPGVCRNDRLWGRSWRQCSSL